MPTAIVYTLDEKNEVIEEFKAEYEFAMRTYWGRYSPKGKYYVAREGIKIPYKKKIKPLKRLPESSS